MLNSRIDVNESAMLLALWHLRYLAAEQIGKIWYPERDELGCLKRLSRLGKSGILKRVGIYHSRWPSAWTLGPEGVRRLRELYAGDFEATKPLKPQFIPHLLETNQVWVILAGGEST